MAQDKDRKNLNVPPLRFPGFTDEWNTNSLSDFFEFKNGLNPDAKRFGQGTKFISVSDILNNDYIDYDRIISSVTPSKKELEEFGVNRGDILFQRSSETLEDVGRANVYMDDRVALFGGFVIRGKKKSEYEPYFMRYALSAPINRKKIIVKGAGAQHFNIGQEGLSKVLMNIPNIDEQTKIGHLLYLIDRRIATQNKIIEDLKKLKSAIIDCHFNGRKANNRLGDLIHEVSNRNKRNTDLPVLSVSNRQGFIAQSEQFDNRIIASDDTSNYKIVIKNDFAYNPARINVGSIARLVNYESGIVSPMYICFRCSDEILPEYLELFFQSRYFQLEVEKRLEGSVRLCLSMDGIKSIQFSLLPIYEQKALTEKLKAIQSKLDNESSINFQYQKIRKHLLSNMFI